MPVCILAAVGNCHLLPPTTYLPHLGKQITVHTFTLLQLDCSLLSDSFLYLTHSSYSELRVYTSNMANANPISDELVANLAAITQMDEARVCCSSSFHRSIY